MNTPSYQHPDEKIDLQEILNPRSKISSISTFAHLLWLKRWTLFLLWMIFGVPSAGFLLFNDVPVTYQATSQLHFPIEAGADNSIVRDDALRDPGSIITLFNSYNVISRTINDKQLRFQLQKYNPIQTAIFENVQYVESVPVGRYTFDFQSPRKLKVTFKSDKSGTKSVVFNSGIPPDNRVTFSGMTLQLNIEAMKAGGDFKVEVDLLSAESVFENFKERLSVASLDHEDATKVNYSVSLRDTDPERAADVLNNLVQNFIAVFKGTTSAQDISMVTRLEKNLQTAREKEKAAQDKLAQFYRENPSLVEIQQGDSYALVTAQTERRQLETRLDYIKQLLNRIPNPDAIAALKSDWISDAVYLLESYGVLQVNSISSRMKELEAKKSELLAANWSPTHPKVAALGKEIVAFQPDLVNLLTTSQQNWVQKLAETKGQESRGLRKNVPKAVELEADRLAIDKQNASRTVEDLQFSLGHASLSGGGRDVFKVDIVDSARPPMYQPPSQIRRLAYSAGAFLLGILPGILWFVFMQVFFSRLFTRQDVERKLRIRFLSAVFQKRRGKIDRTQEGFQFARSEIENYFQSGDPLAFLVTSSRSGEGKSLFSAGVALSFAHQGKKTLWVDADPQHKQPVDPDGLTSGTGLPDTFHKRHLPREAWSPEGMKKFLTATGVAFEVVVVDAPPVLVAADGVNLMKIIPNVVFIVQAGETPFHTSEEALERMAARGVKVGCILNGVQDSPFVKNHFAD